MLTVTVGVQETKDGRLRIHVQREGQGNAHELKACAVIYAMVRALAQYVASDFAARYVDRLSKP